MSKLTNKQIRQIRIDDLAEAFNILKESDDQNIWYKELTAIENAIKYLLNLKND